MAARADFDAQHLALDGRARRESISAGTVDGDGMVVGVDTGFHCSPIYRGRSAREPNSTERMVTAASLGHETISNCKGKRQKRKMAVSDGFEERVKWLRNEVAAEAECSLGSSPAPDGLKIDANGRKNRNMKNRQDVIR